MTTSCDPDLKEMRLGGAGNNAMLSQVLSEMRANDIPRAKAVSLAALSGRESDFIWRQKRRSELALKTPGSEKCWCRQVIGLEIGSVWPSSVQQDPDAATKLKQLGMATGSPPALTPTGPAKALDHDATASFFEWVAAHEKDRILECFSIGPTQMWLALSELHRKPQNKPFACGFVGQDWDDLWNFYVANHTGDMTNRIVYLDPGVCVKPTIKFPGAPDGGGRDNVIAWLSFHVGNLVHAEAYYEGTAIASIPPPSPDKAYKHLLSAANFAADEIGYEF